MFRSPRTGAFLCMKCNRLELKVVSAWCLDGDINPVSEIRRPEIVELKISLFGLGSIYLYLTCVERIRWGTESGGQLV
jgi:hypothetical protein